MDLSELNVYMQQAKKYPLLTREEEITLVRQIKKGGLEAVAARERFLNANLRLVVSMVGKVKYSPLCVQDLVQEGNIGLMRALDKFEPNRGFKFSTYASWWIRQAMMRASQHSDMIRVPVYKVEVRNRIRRAETHIGLHHNERASNKAIAELTGLSLKDVNQLRHIPHVSSSLDDVLSDDGLLVVDTIPDEDAENAELSAILSDIQGKFECLFVDFTERDRVIFEMRFGDDKASLEEIGHAVGLTRERVRQIIERRKKTLKDKAQILGML